MYISAQKQDIENAVSATGGNQRIPLANEQWSSVEWASPLVKLSPCLEALRAESAVALRLLTLTVFLMMDECGLCCTFMRGIYS